MGDTMFLGSQCEEIIVTATLFVIDVYLIWFGSDLNLQ